MAVANFCPGLMFSQGRSSFLIPPTSLKAFPWQLKNESKIIKIHIRSGINPFFFLNSWFPFGQFSKLLKFWVLMCHKASGFIELEVLHPLAKLLGLCGRPCLKYLRLKSNVLVWIYSARERERERERAHFSWTQLIYCFELNDDHAVWHSKQHC